MIVFIGGPRVMTREMRSAVYEYIATLPADTEVLTGGARGVDGVAMEAAHKQGLRVITVRPDYATFGKLAPLVRNGSMAERCDRAVFFWDGQSHGTWDAIRKVRATGKPCDIRLFGTTAAAVRSSLEPATVKHPRKEVALT